MTEARHPSDLNTASAAQQKVSLERMVVDPDNLHFVFQGMLDSDKAGKGYGKFSWRIGMPTSANLGSTCRAATP